jgi:hypothetical protein
MPPKATCLLFSGRQVFFLSEAAPEHEIIKRFHGDPIPSAIGSFSALKLAASN